MSGANSGSDSQWNENSIVSHTTAHSSSPSRARVYKQSGADIVAWGPRPRTPNSQRPAGAAGMTSWDSVSSQRGINGDSNPLQKASGVAFSDWDSQQFGKDFHDRVHVHEIHGDPLLPCCPFIYEGQSSLVNALCPGLFSKNYADLSWQTVQLSDHLTGWRDPHSGQIPKGERLVKVRRRNNKAKLGLLGWLNPTGGFSDTHAEVPPHFPEDAMDIADEGGRATPWWFSRMLSRTYLEPENLTTPRVMPLEEERSRQLVRTERRSASGIRRRPASKAAVV